MEDAMLGDKFGVKKDDIYGVKFLCYTKHMEKL